LAKKAPALGAFSFLRRRVWLWKSLPALSQKCLSVALLFLPYVKQTIDKLK
jgi:hypothetical protein